MAERKINLDDRKYDALKRILAAQGRDIDEEIVARIEALYEDLVPEPEREQIAQALKSEYPEGSFAVYRFKDEGESMYFTSSKVMTLYASAKLYGKIEADGNRVLTLDSIVHRYFGEDGTEIISENTLDETALKEAIGKTGYKVLEVKTEPYEKKKFSFPLSFRGSD